MAIAYHAFLSLFPMLMRLVTVGSFFVDRDRAVSEVIAYAEGYIPLDDAMKGHVFDTIAGIDVDLSVRQSVDLRRLPLRGTDPSLAAAGVNSGGRLKSRWRGLLDLALLNICRSIAEHSQHFAETASALGRWRSLP
jgi:hypothetical protein